MEMPYCKGGAFEIFIDLLSLQHPTELKIMIMDNGAFRKTKTLVLPENLAFIFLPPHSPDLKAAENVWAVLKREFANKPHNFLGEASSFTARATKVLTCQKGKSICGFGYVFSGINLTM